MKKKYVYYAHFMGIYNTPQELRDIEALENLGLLVINPNQKNISDEFLIKQEEYKDNHDGYLNAFDDVFLERVRGCDVFAFKALPDGRIPGGIAMELNVAIVHGKTIIELPSGMNARMMGKEDTREYLREIGQR